jgi:hypothetical protein
LSVDGERLATSVYNVGSFLRVLDVASAPFTVTAEASFTDRQVNAVLLHDDEVLTVTSYVDLAGTVIGDAFERYRIVDGTLLLERTLPASRTSRLFAYDGRVALVSVSSRLWVVDFSVDPPLVIHDLPASGLPLSALVTTEGVWVTSANAVELFDGLCIGP